MKKHYILFILLLFCLVLFGCNDIETESTTTTVLSPTTITDQNWQVSTHLDIGINLDYSTYIISDLNQKYDFAGDKYILFQLIFPKEVEYLYYESPYFDYPLIDRVTVLSDGFEDESVFNYIVSELEEIYTRVIMNDTNDGNTFFMDDLGNILRVEEKFYNEVTLRIVKAFNVVSPQNAENSYFFTYADNVASDIEDLRQKIIDGCPSASVSEIVEGAFTYTFMGYSFIYDESQALLIEGDYHYSISLVQE